MPFFSYDQTILGTQSTVDGAAFNYNLAPAAGTTWSYTGSAFTHTVFENNPAASLYNGDPTNEQVAANLAVGAVNEQSTVIGGNATTIIYDYSFTVTGGGVTYTVAVLDADLNGDGDVNDAGEDGYYLIFVGAVPPPGTPLVSNGISANPTSVPHADLGGVVVCFVAGTRILTADGERAIEEIKPDDLIVTKDNGLQPVRWIGSRTVAGLGNFAPICFQPNVVGNRNTLMVSPQHRMLISGWQAELNFGEPEVLVAAKHLVNDDTIRPAPQAQVEYFHILFDNHQIIIAEGAPTESFHPGKTSISAMADESREEILCLFPELRDDLTSYGPAARISLKSNEAQLLKL